MSDDDVELICINLDSDANSDDEFVEKPARNERKSEPTRRKRFVQRKRAHLIESDDESNKKRQRKKSELSSDSDYKPSPKRVGTKPKVPLQSKDDSSKKRDRKNLKSSKSFYEFEKKKTMSKSERYESDDEKARSSLVDVSRVAVHRKRMKVTSLRERKSVDEADEADGSGDIPSRSGGSSLDTSDKGHVSDAGKAESSAVDASEAAMPRKRKKETPLRERDDEKARSSLVDVSRVAVHRKRMKVTSLRERKSVDEADEADGSGDIPSRSGGSSPDTSDKGHVSDAGKAESSAVDASEAAMPRKRKKETPLRERADVVEVDDEDDSESIVNGSGSSLDSNNKGLDSDTEKRKNSSVEVSEKVAPMGDCSSSNEVSKDDVDDGKEHPVTSSSRPNFDDDSLDPDRKKPESSSIEMTKKVELEGECSSESKADTAEADEGMNIPDQSIEITVSSICDPDLKAEKRSICSHNVSTNAASKTEDTEAPLSESSCENEISSDEADDKFASRPKPCGFELGLVAEKVIGITNHDPDGIKFLIQFHGQENAELILNDKCRQYCPKLILDFYEKHIRWSIPFPR